MRGEWGNSLKQTYVEGVGVGRTYKMNRDEQRGNGQKLHYINQNYFLIDSKVFSLQVRYMLS